ncbi:MAG: hypothetical protein ACE5JH_01405 [Acidobacteriota bacterium]
MLERSRDDVDRRVRMALIADGGGAPDTPLDILTEYEGMLASGDPGHRFADFDEGTPATILYSTGTTSTCGSLRCSTCTAGTSRTWRP